MALLMLASSSPALSPIPMAARSKFPASRHCAPGQPALFVLRARDVTLEREATSARESYCAEKKHWPSWLHGKPVSTSCPRPSGCASEDLSLSWINRAAAAALELEPEMALRRGATFAGSRWAMMAAGSPSKASSMPPRATKWRAMPLSPASAALYAVDRSSARPEDRLHRLCRRHDPPRRARGRVEKRHIAGNGGARRCGAPSPSMAPMSGLDSTIRLISTCGVCRISFLRNEPYFVEILEELRSSRRISEHADFRAPPRAAAPLTWLINRWKS